MKNIQLTDKLLSTILSSYYTNRKQTLKRKINETEYTIQIGDEELIFSSKINEKIKFTWQNNHPDHKVKKSLNLDIENNFPLSYNELIKQINVNLILQIHEIDKVLVNTIKERIKKNIWEQYGTEEQFVKYKLTENNFLFPQELHIITESLSFCYILNMNEIKNDNVENDLSKYPMIPLKLFQLNSEISKILLEESLTRNLEEKTKVNQFKL